MVEALLNRLDYSDRFRMDMIAEFGGARCPSDIKDALQYGRSVYPWLAPYVATRHRSKDAVLAELAMREPTLSLNEAERRVDALNRLALDFCDEITRNLE